MRCGPLHSRPAVRPQRRAGPGLEPERPARQRARATCAATHAGTPSAVSPKTPRGRVSLLLGLCETRRPRPAPGDSQATFPAVGQALEPIRGPPVRPRPAPGLLVTGTCALVLVGPRSRISQPVLGKGSRCQDRVPVGPARPRRSHGGLCRRRVSAACCLSRRQQAWGGHAGATGGAGQACGRAQPGVSRAPPPVLTAETGTTAGARGHGVTSGQPRLSGADLRPTASPHGHQLLMGLGAKALLGACQPGPSAGCGAGAPCPHQGRASRNRTTARWACVP